MKLRWVSRFFTGLTTSLLVISLICVPVPANAIAQRADAAASSPPSIFQDCALQTQIPVSECNALVALYNRTRGAEWSDQTGWLETNTPCSWFGITCGGGSHVTELDLADNNLVGRIPHELGNLTRLQVLYLGIPRAISIGPEVRFPESEKASPDGVQHAVAMPNRLSGTIPSELGDLTHLRLLALSGNQLTGIIPPELGNLSHLQVLALDGNQLNGGIPPELAHLTGLEELYLRFNQLTGAIPPALGELSNIHILALSSNQLSGSIPAELGNLTGLYYLVLNNNQLSGAIPPELGGLADLELLILSDNELSGFIPPEMGSLTGLSWLYLHHNHLRGEFPGSISGLSSLETFSFDCWLSSTDPTVISFIEGLNPGWQNRICPIVTSITRSDPNPPSSSRVQFLVTFNEPVTGVTVDDFVLETNGVTGASITAVNGSETAYAVSVDAGFGKGTIRLDVPETATIYNLAGNPLADLPFTSGEAYTIMLMDCAAQTQIPETECEALVALFYSAGGADWTHDNGWLQNAAPCSWYGVTCGNGTNVTELRFHNNHLVGAIPAQLGNLLHLTCLDLDRNQLSGPVPAELGRLTNLQTLMLDANQLTGSIPSELGDLSNLETLRLHINRLTGSIPVELANLAKLKDLRLSLNFLTGPAPAELGSLSNLEYLDLEGNRLTGPLPAELGNLTSLHTLLLYGNQFTGSIPSELGQLSNVTILALLSNQFSGSIPVEFANLSKLEDLRLSDNQLTGTIPPQLGTLSNLRVLALSDNQLTGPIPPEMGDLSNLDSLYLNRNQLSGPIPPELGNLSELIIVHLGNNRLAGPIPPSLGNLSELQILSMENNQLTGSIPNEIGNMISLYALHLPGNQLRGEIPADIVNLAGLRYFEYDCWLTSTDPVTIAFLEDRWPGWQTKVCPIISSITRASANPTNSSQVQFTVTFSEDVTGVNLADFVLTHTGVTGAAITKIEGAKQTYTVAVKTGTGDGTIRLDVLDNDSIRNAFRNPLGGLGSGNGDFTAGEEYTIVKSVAVPSAPTLTSPATGTLVTTLRAAFDWQDSIPAAHHYQIQISTSNNFDPLAIDATDTSISTFTPAVELAPGRTYYWRVRAFNMLGVASGWSKVWNFKTPLAQPVLVAPADTDSLLTDRPAFEWNEVDGATQYNLQVSASPDFGALLVNVTSSGTEYIAIKDLAQIKLLYWRVRAKSSSVTGGWSDAWTFTTGNPATVPALVAPTNNALVKSYTPLLNWNNSKLPAGTTFKDYEVQLDEDAGFAAPDTYTTTLSDITDSDFTPSSDLASNTKYYWRVRAVNVVNGLDHYSGWSIVRSFRTVLAPPTGLTATPNTLQPTFEWDDASGSGEIKSYTIQVSINPNFKGLLLNVTTQDSFYQMLKNLPPATTFHWRVRVNGANGPSEWTKSQFTTP